MEQRPTIMITLPRTKAKVTLYEYLTVRDNREIKKTLLKDMQIEVDSEGKQKQETHSFSGALGVDMQAETYAHLVKEIVTESGEVVSDIRAFIDDLPSEDGDVLFAEADRLTDDSNLSPERKKK